MKLINVALISKILINEALAEVPMYININLKIIKIWSEDIMNNHSQLHSPLQKRGYLFELFGLRRDIKFSGLRGWKEIFALQKF